MTVLTDCAQLVKANSIQGTYMTVNLTGLTYSLCGMQLSLSPGWHYCVCSCAGHFTLGLGIGTSKLSVLVLENNVHEIPYILLE